MSYYQKNYFNNTRIVKQQQGFTMIELTMVIVIVSIVGAVAGPRFWGNNLSIQANVYTRELLSSVRFAQKTAIASGCDIQVNFPDDKSYSLSTRASCTTGAFGVNIDMVDQSVANNQTPANITMGYSTLNKGTAGVTSLPAPANFYFDGVGRPVNSSDNQPYVNTVFKINVGPGVNTIIVESQTGFTYL